ncbi:Bromodomain testis-specific protein [Seminavis robusta]|uniref:Bromodomain testis-specific protein n=1 Tax=Seminavis robusta TaxID=568900 RepID=A0A9N8DDC9_9STRA|nr:Bromodomain testis-specific protein [Seminavis robusta]|eukprot:Sro67_g037720.1 Bromodomain testis-specific protein (224) ;mRNA; f:105608-106566
MASSPTPEMWSAMTKLVQSFFQKPDAEPFREPVDWQNMGLYDYPKVVKKPMDLGTIKKNIVDRKYKTLMDANEDVKLVWFNCMTYNQDGSDFYILAQTLNKKWNEKYKKLMDDLRIKDDTPVALSSGVDKRVSNDDKRAFAKSLYKISKEDLGKILVELEKKAPSSLNKNSAEDEIDLNIDKIPAPLFSDLQTFVKNAIKADGGKVKKKASGGGGGGNKRQKA